MKTSAFISEDRLYRWWLLRQWDELLPLLCVIGLNPSKADETANDPTIRKGIGFATRLGYGSLLMLNIGAYRATDPKDWRRSADPIGELNSPIHLVEYARSFGAHRIVAAWGSNGRYAIQQCQDVLRAFPTLWCWGTNSDGTPSHPLMLPYSSPLQLYGD